LPDPVVGWSLHLNTPLVELITSNGAVVGAVVEQDGRRRAIHARAGVLLAAGGFENNPALRERFGVPGDARDTMGAPANVGLALEAGLAAGAAIDLMDQAWWSPGFTHPDGRSSFSLWFTGGIFVNQDGKRFVNESAPYDRIGKAIIDQIASGAMTLLRLYAAGNTMAAVSGTVYPGAGIPIGASMLFSHLAAKHMAAKATRN
jgi:3-oxosteroid 1-dehydrogenase